MHRTYYSNSETPEIWFDENKRVADCLYFLLSLIKVTAELYQKDFD